MACSLPTAGVVVRLFWVSISVAVLSFAFHGCLHQKGVGSRVSRGYFQVSNVLAVNDALSS